MRIHINPVGGIAGDMFVSVVLDLRPDLRDSCIEALACFKGFKSLKHSGSILNDLRFEIRDEIKDARKHIQCSRIKKC